MKVEQVFTVAAPREEVARFLTNIDELRTCVPGLESVEELGGNRYRGTLTSQFGPIKAAFQGELELDTSQVPTRLTATGSGRDRATGTTVTVAFTADLAETSETTTTVTATADVVLRGRMARFGSGVVKATAAELVKDFSAEVNARLARPAAPVAAHLPAAHPGTTGPQTAPAAPEPMRSSANHPPAPSPPAANPSPTRRLNARLILRIVARALWSGITRPFRRTVPTHNPRDNR